ncbi:MAG: Rv2175c family DNA-binding protein [Gulosibacter sp.]|uniref:Rv2175c family DNA-binding protein n=1 Tax=Gulosibacter sp. TaxID=2817531 RepID=UPI003F90FE2F
MSTQYSSFEWFSLSEAAKELGVSSGRLNRLIEERYLLAVKHDGEPRIPKDFIIDGQPLAGLRGTLTLLADHGVVNHEAMEWLLAEDEVLGVSPTKALQEGRKSSVRRSVQLLAI